MTAYAFPAVNYGSCNNLISMFFDQAKRFGDKPFLWSKIDGAYKSQSWAQTAEEVRALAYGLIDLGLATGDRVVLVSENRPEWGVADLAILAAGGITTPAYVTNTTKDHAYIYDNVAASMVIVSTAALAKRVIEAALIAKVTPKVILLEPDGVDKPEGLEVVTWANLVARGTGTDQSPQPVNSLKPDDAASIIHTSGTGGKPKGVVLSHRAILHNCMGAYHLLEPVGLGDEVFLSFLPLSHSYEHTTGLFFPISIGAQIYYAEGIEHLTTNMAEVKPTIMTAVPRLYEAIRMKVLRGVSKQSGFKATLFHKTVELGMKKSKDPNALSMIESVTDALCTILVRRKVAGRFGGRLKAFVSGGAPLNPDVGHFFTALGVRILQGYGLTETAPVLACNLPHKVKMHTVGPPFRGVNIIIAEDGEILAEGPMVMTGYWNDPEATAAAIDAEGRLHTGDIGRLDEDGYLMITDRKKDIIVNSGGDNISPQRVEGVLGLQGEIGQAMVYGDKKPHLVALIVPDEDFLRGFAVEKKRTGVPLAELVDDPDLRAAISEAIDRSNMDLSVIEKVRRFIIAPEGFTVENEQMTPTLKLRRHVVKAVYQDKLEGLYGKS